MVEEGEVIKMKPGDVVIQRGTMHAWSNLSDSWARMHFILIGEWSYPSHKDRGVLKDTKDSQVE